MIRMLWIVLAIALAFTLVQPAQADDGADLVVYVLVTRNGRLTSVPATVRVDGRLVAHTRVGRDPVGQIWSNYAYFPDLPRGWHRVQVFNERLSCPSPRVENIQGDNAIYVVCRRLPWYSSGKVEG